MQDLEEERARLGAQLQAAREAAAAAGDAAALRAAQQEALDLTERNAALEAAARSGGAERVAELEAAHAAALAENGRLRVRIEPSHQNPLSCCMQASSGCMHAWTTACMTTVFQLSETPLKWVLVG